MTRIVVVLLLALASAGCSPEGTLTPPLLVLDDASNGRWVMVSAGAEHTCALDLDRRAYCWGSNRYSQLGVELTASTCGESQHPCSTVPLPLESGRSFASISAGGSHTCAVSTDSVPYCWGRNGDGQLGVSGPGSAGLRVPGTSQMIQISAGLLHSCGIRADHLLVCWGSNRFGAVGSGAGTGVLPTIVGGNQRFVEVEASDHRTCARTTSGRVLCWGALWSRSSGDTNFTVIRNSPTPVPGLGSMADMDVGPSSACSTDATGFAWCWETNINGESGTGPGDGTSTPRRAATNEQLTTISVGAAHACATTVSGTTLCWGSNRFGQLGTIAPERCGPSRAPCSTVPIAVAGRQRFISISAGLGNHVCAISERFNLYCWGAGGWGQRGDGTASLASRIPRLPARVHQE